MCLCVHSGFHQPKRPSNTLIRICLQLMKATVLAESSLYLIFSLDSLRSSDVYRHESGRCRTLPFFLTLLLIKLVTFGHLLAGGILSFLCGVELTLQDVKVKWERFSLDRLLMVVSRMVTVVMGLRLLLLHWRQRGDRVTMPPEHSWTWVEHFPAELCHQRMWSIWCILNTSRFHYNLKYNNAITCHLNIP